MIAALAANARANERKLMPRWAEWVPASTIFSQLKIQPLARFTRVVHNRADASDLPMPAASVVE